MVMSLYENNIPMRFGIIMYSSKLIKKIETGGGGIYSSSMENDNQIEDDLSSLVIASS